MSDLGLATTVTTSPALVAPGVLAPPSGAQRPALARVLTTPLVLLLVLGALYAWVSSKELDSIEQRTLNRDYLLTSVVEHLKIALLASALILLIAVPLGIVLSRRSARYASPPFLVLANIGQALPAIGLLVLLTLKLGIGLRVALIAFVAYGVLPVLRNTIVGL